MQASTRFPFWLRIFEPAPPAPVMLTDAAATAVGLTGFFGYLSTLLSGVGFGTLVKLQGWNAGFAGLLGIAAIGAILFLFAWPAKAHGYTEEVSA